jgi:Tfp pilus assembly protein PilF
LLTALPESFFAATDDSQIAAFYIIRKRIFPIVSFSGSKCVLQIGLMLAISSAVCGQTAASEISAEQLALQRGEEALKNRDLSGARVQFDKAVQLAPRDAKAQSALGWVLAQQGELDAAVVHLKAAVRAKPGGADIRLTLAGVLTQRFRWPSRSR